MAGRLRFRTHVAGLAVGILGVGLLSACGFGTHLTSSPGAPPSTSPSVQAAASNTRSAPPLAPSSTGASPITNPSNLPSCTPSSLTLRLAGSVPALGSVIRVYAFTNHGSNACSLFGYPSLQMYNAQGQTIQTLITHVTMAENVVPIEPGGEAWFVIHYPDATGFAHDRCPASSEIAVTPPGASNSILIKGHAGIIEPFGGTAENLACGPIFVQPVTPQGTPPSP